MFTKEEVKAKLANVLDPELGLSIVDLGLIYDIEVLDEKSVYISMTLTFPGCPYGPTLLSDAEEAVKELPDVKKVDIDIVWDPPWNPSEMASEFAKDVLGIW
ncbi:MAG TPA: aromatic ring hydroxylase [candidate division Zixibacteria bacterium]|nr:aromatic ring hydroxylase [candidate division Zixibacteria bacterium]